MNEKLIGFPKVYYVSLEERTDRQFFMQEQFTKYGIDGTAHLTKRIADMDPAPVLTGPYAYTLGQGAGIVVSHLNCMKHWYYNTDEEYAIFCEDDHDFSTIDSWTFTWNDFFNNLPDPWECVQLIRIVSPLGEGYMEDLKLDLRYGRWWGGASLMRRSWVKKLLDRHIVSEYEYRLDIGDIQPIIENVLYWGAGPMFNFPLITENNNLEGTIKECTDEQYIQAKIPHKVSEQTIKDCWKSLSPDVKIQDLLRI